jgi:uncharacterized protein (TIGR02145 family)
MMNKNENYLLCTILIGIFIISTYSCDKEDINNTNGRTTAVFNDNLTYGTLTDQDGNIYKTITIGTQTWMAENLRTTKYNDGIAIPNVSNVEEWCALTTGAYCNYDNTNDAELISTYGRLYTWYAVKTGKLAPIGWHVASDADWRILTSYVDGEGFTGDKLKEVGALHWPSPNADADNSSGFTALPGGARCFWEGDSVFGGLGLHGAWWSSDYWYGDIWVKLVLNDAHGTYLEAVNLEERVFGFSVRCIKD